MPVVIVTGSGGLIGSESVRHFVEQGYDVVGIENDMRARFFGPDASTAHQTRRLVDLYDAFRSEGTEAGRRKLYRQLAAPWESVPIPAHVLEPRALHPTDQVILRPPP